MFCHFLGSGTSGRCHVQNQPDSGSGVGQVTHCHHFDLCFPRSGQWNLLVHACVSDKKESVPECSPVSDCVITYLRAGGVHPAGANFQALIGEMTGLPTAEARLPSRGGAQCVGGELPLNLPSTVISFQFLITEDKPNALKGLLCIMSQVGGWDE